MASQYDLDPEAIAWARAGVQRAIDKMRRLQKYCENQKDEVGARGWKKAANLLELDVMGDGTGCVITTFDPRLPELLPLIEEAAVERAKTNND